MIDRYFTPGYVTHVRASNHQEWQLTTFTDIQDKTIPHTELEFSIWQFYKKDRSQTKVTRFIAYYFTGKKYPDLALPPSFILWKAEREWIIVYELELLVAEDNYLNISRALATRIINTPLSIVDWLPCDLTVYNLRWEVQAIPVRTHIPPLNACLSIVESGGEVEDDRLNAPDFVPYKNSDISIYLKGKYSGTTPPEGISDKLIFFMEAGFSFEMAVTILRKDNNYAVHLDEVVRVYKEMRALMYASKMYGPLRPKEFIVKVVQSIVNGTANFLYEIDDKGVYSLLKIDLEDAVRQFFPEAQMMYVETELKRLSSPYPVWMGNGFKLSAFGESNYRLATAFFCDGYWKDVAELETEMDAYGRNNGKS